MRRALRHWLLALNAGIAAFIAGAVLAPVFGRVGWQSLADQLYLAYHLACHQWAFRSFFLFGQQGVYSEAQLASLGVDPFGFAGNPDLGWKMAICERDVAIYVGLLVVGLLYARRPALVRPIGFGLYALLILPMAVDGFTQLFGFRESTWELRILTGALFGVASAWLVLPLLQEALVPERISAGRAAASPAPSTLVAERTTSHSERPASASVGTNLAARQPGNDVHGPAERYAPAEEHQPLACDPPFPTPQPAPPRG